MKTVAAIVMMEPNRYQFVPAMLASHDPAGDADLVLAYDCPEHLKMASVLYPGVNDHRSIVIGETSPWVTADHKGFLNAKILCALHACHGMGYRWCATMEQDVSFEAQRGLDGKLESRWGRRIVWGADIQGQGQYITGSCLGLFKGLGNLWHRFNNCQVYTYNSDLQWWRMETFPAFAEKAGLVGPGMMERLNWHTFTHVAYQMYLMIDHGFELVVVNRRKDFACNHDFKIYGIEYQDEVTLAQMPKPYFPMQFMAKNYRRGPAMSDVWVTNHHARA